MRISIYWSSLTRKYKEREPKEKPRGVIMVGGDGTLQYSRVVVYSCIHMIPVLSMVFFVTVVW